MNYKPKYSGPTKSGICKCGHSWTDHHLSMVANEEYIHQTNEYYLPSECLFYGCNETGGLDKDGNDHCFRYDDLLKWD